MERDAMILLGLSPDEPASADDIKRAYQQAARDARDPERVQEVRTAYELVKDGYQARASSGDAVLRQFEEHVRRNRPEDDAKLGNKTIVVLSEALAMLERGDLAGARSFVEANPVDVLETSLDRDLMHRYVGLQELVERAAYLPSSAVPAFSRALRDYEDGMPSSPLIEYRQDHPRDARRAFRIILASQARVLREMVALVEPRRFAVPRVPVWAAWAILVLVVLLLGRFLTET